ncbi:GntR family transcriptional regulator [Peterkaempfera bronchialis]|uniref:GntR family transcriptional regulator n=1 Tax=Peterkaempfera bronchialis TaxID=2126346 RepID=A0A345SRA0_9ACTN|nr:GntR family transcriptional regulator [Peterkaempfera bronchialis]AXI76255.1 GntR family transcriptional regulator [Peterkaempfera bronchialis]
MAQTGWGRSIGAGDRSLRDQVYEALRELIIEGQLAPGQRVVERNLAEEFEVSRIPVREAMQRLEAEAFLTTLPRRGTIVSQVGVEDTAHFFDVREHLEALAADLAARHADPAGLRRLEQLLARARRAAERGRARDVAALNADFHRQIVVLSGNPLLQDLMQPLDGRLRRLFRLTAEPGDGPLMCGEHEELFHAVRAGDPETAAHLARRHVANTRATALEILAARAAADGQQPQPATAGR